MRKIIFIFFAASFFFLFLKNTVNAQFTPSISDVALPGVSCGNMDSKVVSEQKCCYNKPLDGKFLDYGPPLNVVTDFINGILKDVLTPLLQMQRQTIVQPCATGTPSTPGNPGDPSCKCVKSPDVPLTALVQLCDSITSRDEKNACLSCIGGTDGSGAVGVWTGLGCIYTNTGEFIKKTVFGTMIGLAGVIALLCIMYAAFTLQTSRGNPEKIKKAQELLTSCIMGLMLVIFSVFILKLIGVDILKIPDFIK